MRRPRIGRLGVAAAQKVLLTLTALAFVLGAGAWLPVPNAEASRPLLSEAFLHTTYCLHCGPPAPGGLVPPPEGQLEDPCGLAVGPAGEIYVADYYHRAVDVFAAEGGYAYQIALPGGPISGLGINERDAVCGLAVDASRALYADEWHQAVVRLRPGEFTLDRGESTGVAVDAAGDVFVDDRTYVAEYAAPVTAGEEPVARIGEGVLSDAYGVAVSASGGRVYVADAASGRVKVLERAGEVWAAVASLAPPGGFTSLVDSALAIDATLEPGLPEHLLVLDDLEPGYEHPEAAVEEFEAPGAAHPASYAYLGRLRGPAGAPIIDGEPSGLAVDGAGDVLVTDGNGELANAFEFGPDPPGEAAQTSPAGPPDPGAGLKGVAAPPAAAAAAAGVAGPGGAQVTPYRRPRRHRRRRRHRRHAHRPAHARPGLRSTGPGRVR